jgi:FixJ family two-component response regulator
MELSSATVEARVPETPEISIIDDDESAREGKMDLLKSVGHRHEQMIDKCMYTHTYLKDERERCWIRLG